MSKRILLPKRDFNLFGLDVQPEEGAGYMTGDKHFFVSEKELVRKVKEISRMKVITVKKKGKTRGRPSKQEKLLSSLLNYELKLRRGVSV